MLRQLTGHMRHNVVAYLALFFALSGTAIAAKPLLTSADIQDGSLAGVDVRNDSLTGDDILESSLGQVGDADTLDGKDSTAFGSPNAAVSASDMDGIHHFGTALGELVDITVTPGTWLFVAKATVFTSTATGAEPNCYLSPNNTTKLDQATTSLTQGQSDSLSLTTVQTLAEETTIRMWCRDSAASANQSAFAMHAHITAIRAG